MSNCSTEWESAKSRPHKLSRCKEEKRTSIALFVSSISAMIAFLIISDSLSKLLRCMSIEPIGSTTPIKVTTRHTTVNRNSIRPSISTCHSVSVAREGLSAKIGNPSHIHDAKSKMFLTLITPSVLSQHILTDTIDAPRNTYQIRINDTIGQIHLLQNLMS